MTTVNANQALWEKGDFSRIADTMRPSGEEVVTRIGVRPGMEVLDLACGDGNTAIPEARAGASVTGIDISTTLVAAARARAQAFGLTNCRFQHGDASHLDGIDDNSFDLVVSMFGAMFAPNPFNVAAEMARVTRPGGRIVMGNWIGGDPTVIAQVLRISAAYSPPPPDGFVSPVTWGDPQQVRERFGAAGIDESAIRCDKATWRFTFAGPPAEYLDVYADYYGPTMNAFAAAAEQGRADELRRELVELFESCNESGEPGRTELVANYLLVSVSV